MTAFFHDSSLRVTGICVRLASVPPISYTQESVSQRPWGETQKWGRVETQRQGYETQKRKARRQGWGGNREKETRRKVGTVGLETGGERPRDRGGDLETGG